ncbi:MAG: thermonuclease family protein [Bosea sp. (in: a-proteobacteria)]|uniref:thermonuclease family protein n=1 Tax=Bosea sp. (in: a-proteobacteria) TaxID=1871050 RepID=UPI003F7B377E
MIRSSDRNLQCTAPLAIQSIRCACLILALGIACISLAIGARGQESGRSRYKPKLPTQSPPLRVEVIDGVRFRDIETGTVYRLFGIDACAPAQTAMLGRQPWPCGTAAAAWLVNATLNKWLTCAPIREDASEQVVRCATASYHDLSAAMLKEGLAVVAPAVDGDPVIRSYAAAEAQSRKAFRGLWSSAFQMPWDWRAEHGDSLKAGNSGKPAQ